MKVLVLSDSHSALRFMRQCVEAVMPDAMIHLGDYFDDGEAIHELYPQIPFYQVPGNCDRYRCPPGQPEILVIELEGVRLYLTHGHRHQVKLTRGLLVKDAQAARVDAVLYGHTHSADCHREEGGLLVMNPGSCGSCGGSVGVLEIRDGKILDARILRESDLV